MAERKLRPHAWKSVISFKPKISGINQSHSNIVGSERIRESKNVNIIIAMKAVNFTMMCSID
jgi:hypothetical protein